MRPAGSGEPPPRAGRAHPHRSLIVPAGCTGLAPADDTMIDVAEIDDCDKKDRRKKERPDCGRIVGGKYVEWSWVKGGKRKPPAGWIPAKD